MRRIGLGACRASSIPVYSNMNGLGAHGLQMQAAISGLATIPVPTNPEFLLVREVRTLESDASF
eukprot:scaffold14032_cov24-Prasinocladus_malaysianus.AAC.1